MEPMDPVTPRWGWWVNLFSAFYQPTHNFNTVSRKGVLPSFIIACAWEKVNQVFNDYNETGRSFCLSRTHLSKKYGLLSRVESQNVHSWMKTTKGGKQVKWTMPAVFTTIISVCYYFILYNWLLPQQGTTKSLIGLVINTKVSATTLKAGTKMFASKLTFH